MERKILTVTSHYITMSGVCKLYFDRIVNQGIILPSSDGIMKGTLMHAALEFYYKSLQNDSNEFLGAIKNGISAINKCVLEGRADDKGRIDTITLSEENIKLVQDTYLAYCAFRSEERPNFITIEERMSKVLYENDKIVIIYEGKMDAVEERQGITIPWDHKTESSKFPPISLTNQFLGYCFLTDSSMLIRNAIGFQKTKKPEEKFYRNMYSYPNSLIEKWKVDTIEECMNLLYCYETNKWPMSFHSCEKSSIAWFGCPFKDICSGDPDDWERSLDATYQKTNVLYNETEVEKK
jgi:hypothetical protein